MTRSVEAWSDVWGDPVQPALAERPEPPPWHEIPWDTSPRWAGRTAIFCAGCPGVSKPGCCQHPDRAPLPPYPPTVPAPSVLGRLLTRISRHLRRHHDHVDNAGSAGP